MLDHIDVDHLGLSHKVEFSFIQLDSIDLLKAESAMRLLAIHTVGVGGLRIHRPDLGYKCTRTI